MTSCPLCRADFPTDAEANNSMIRHSAENGRSWAQITVGTWYWNGSDGCPVDKREALKWVELAAEQHHPRALGMLAGMYKDGVYGIVTQSESRAMSLRKEAADLGNSRAQAELAHMYQYRNSGEEDQQKAALYMTLAGATQGGQASCHLGESFYYGLAGFNKSLYRAKHYFEEAAGNNDDAAYYLLAMTLLELNAIEYKGVKSVPGHCCIPKVLFWARKALASEQYKARAIQLIEQVLSTRKQFCANCKRNAECLSEKMKQCVRCKAAWYCGRECQVKHWKDGHKTECIKQK